PSVVNNNIVDKINYEDDENLFEDATIDEEEEVQTYTPISIDLDEVKSNLYNAISHYWPNLTTPNSFLPCLLDPRCKSLTFVTFDEQFATENLLYEEYTVKSTSTGKNAKNSILSSFKKYTPATVEELSDYLKLEEIDFDCDPFVWWHERRNKFSVMSQLAKKYLAVYTSSTASERLFSDAGNLITAKRTRI
ncbi:13634_t:CDS:2, partial [Racocetra fulgida]